jgi:hypothetical protein
MGRSVKLTGVQDTGQALQFAAYDDFWKPAGPARQGGTRCLDLIRNCPDNCQLENLPGIYFLVCLGVS